MTPTRAQFIAAVDEAHAALHSAIDGGLPRPGEPSPLPACVLEAIARAHGALHRVGAGTERVECATCDPEAQRLYAELRESLQRELPCGHKLEDLISGTEPGGRKCITTCGACVAERQVDVQLWHRLRRAWRASGMSLGKLIVRVFGNSDLTAISDGELVSRCERYVREPSVRVDIRRQCSTCRGFFSLGMLDVSTSDGRPAGWFFCPLCGARLPGDERLLTVKEVRCFNGNHPRGADGICKLDGGRS